MEVEVRLTMTRASEKALTPGVDALRVQYTR